jgi:predicted RNase H-like HicB family nuclease
MLMTATDATRDQQIAVIVTRPYRKVIHGDAVQGFLGEVLELPGCMTAGDSETEALINLRDAMEAWVESPS